MPDPNEKTPPGGPAREKSDSKSAKAEAEAEGAMLDQLGELQADFAAQGSSVAEVIAAAGKALLGLTVTPAPPTLPPAK